MPRRVADYLDERRLHRPQPDLDRRGVPARGVDAAVPVERVADPARRLGTAGRRRPVGRADARVGHDVAAAARELRRAAAADPLEPAGVGPATTPSTTRPSATAGAHRDRHRGACGPRAEPTGRRPQGAVAGVRRHRRCSCWCIGAIYWATAYEESGTVMLLLAAGLLAVDRRPTCGCAPVADARAPGGRPAGERTAPRPRRASTTCPTPAPGRSPSGWARRRWPTAWCSGCG